MNDDNEKFKEVKQLLNSDKKNNKRILIDIRTMIAD